MAPKKVELTDELLLDIETAVSCGAKTNKEIAEAIGWTESKFINYRYGKGSRGAYVDPFNQAIKRGEKTGRKNALAVAKNTLLQRLTFHEVEETEQEMWTDGNGTERKKMKKKKRVIPPSDMLIAFTMVNNSDGEYQSINKVDTTLINNNTNEIPAIGWTKPREQNEPES